MSNDTPKSLGEAIPFNRLMPAETERLALLAEELGEAQQAVGKILRHGYESGHPDSNTTNRQDLMRELGDVLCAIDLLCLPNGDLNFSHINHARHDKHRRVREYLHHQEDIFHD